jgi:hypothetical protein
MKRFVVALALGFVLSVVSLIDSGDRGRPGWTGFELAFTEANARGRGGHRGGGGARHGARPSRSAHASMRRPRSQPPRRDMNRNVNRNTNRNVNRNVNVDVDRRHGGALIAGAVVAGAVIASLPPDCNTVFIDGVNYYDCNNEYYVESFQGTEVVYQPVPAPN